MATLETKKNSIGIKVEIKEKGHQACELNDNVVKIPVVYKFSFPQSWQGWYQSSCGNVKDLARSRQCWVEESRRPTRLGLPPSSEDFSTAGGLR